MKVSEQHQCCYESQIYMFLFARSCRYDKALFVNEDVAFSASSSEQSLRSASPFSCDVSRLLSTQPLLLIFENVWDFFLDRWLGWRPPEMLTSASGYTSTVQAPTDSFESCLVNRLVLT